MSRLDQILKIGEEKLYLRELLSLEKVVVMGVLDSMIRESYGRIEKEGKPILDAIIGVYFSILEYLSYEEINGSHH